ncbi:MAG: universal stress protein [Nitrospira sp.]|nr:universal stress protein [Nitrospira sp.]
MARRLNARVVLVYAAEPSDSQQSDPLRVDELSLKRYAHQFQKIISASRAEGVIADQIVITGNAVAVVLDRAKHRKTNLIIVGTHHRRGMKRLMLGTVAKAVVRRAACRS